MAPPIPIPADVRLWLSGVFAGCNERVAGTMTQVPTIHEVPLDMTFIQHFLSVSAPHRFPSGWTVEISTHYLGGGRHYGEWGDWPRRWEIADIGLLVVFRQGGKVLRSKVALLQSKRVTQYNAIASYEQQRNIPVYYLLYNPHQVPSSAIVPLIGEQEPKGTCEVGCRIVPARQLRIMLTGQPHGHSPAYGELHASLGDPFTPALHPAGWRLEHFVAGLLLDCETGYIAESRTDGGLNYIFNRRSGPIAAALAVTLDAPA